MTHHRNLAILVPVDKNTRPDRPYRDLASPIVLDKHAIKDRGELDLAVGIINNLPSRLQPFPGRPQLLALQALETLDRADEINGFRDVSSLLYKLRFPSLFLGPFLGKRELLARPDLLLQLVKLGLELVDLVLVLLLVVGRQGVVRGDVEILQFCESFEQGIDASTCVLIIIIAKFCDVFPQG